MNCETEFVFDSPTPDPAWLLTADQRDVISKQLETMIDDATKKVWSQMLSENPGIEYDDAQDLRRDIEVHVKAYLREVLA